MSLRATRGHPEHVVFIEFSLVISDFVLFTHSVQYVVFVLLSSNENSFSFLPTYRNVMIDVGGGLR